MESAGILDALDDAYEIVLGELRPSCIPDAASAERNLANALAKLPTLTPGPPGTKAKRKYLNAIGKFIGGAVAGISNVLLITGWLSLDAGREAIASCGVAIGSFFAGLVDLKRE